MIIPGLAWLVIGQASKTRLKSLLVIAACIVSISSVELAFFAPSHLSHSIKGTPLQPMTTSSKEELQLGFLESNLEALGGEEEDLTFEELSILGGDLLTDQIEGPARPGSAIDRMRRTFDKFYEKYIFQSDDFLEVEPDQISIPSLIPIETATMTSGFGVRKSPFSKNRRFHRGIDLKARYGTPVMAAGSGRVVSTNYHRSYGRMVVIDHGNGLESRYAHNSSILVNVGDQVNKGAIISKVGMTGRTTGPHLHFEIWLHGHAINPLKFVDIAFHRIAKEAFVLSRSAADSADTDEKTNSFNIQEGEEE
jgi:hypothetical protein